MNKSIEQQIGEVRDRQEIVDTLYRFTRGIDINDMTFLAASLTKDAVVDFTSAAKKLDIKFPMLIGQDMIVSVLGSSVALLDTTHTVTNPLIAINDNSAKLHALVEAQHLPPKDHHRHCLMKNQYDVDCICINGHWMIEYMLIDNAWYTGDPKVVLGQ